LEKTAGHMQETIKLIENMSKLRKKNVNRKYSLTLGVYERPVEDNKSIKKDDFEETKNNENPNRSNLQFSLNDYELLFLASQTIPVMDRLGRLLSGNFYINIDVSLHLSHLILNPSLYPQLLLGHNQNIEVSDTLSCASGYSMYTNEGSIMSGLQDQNIINNLQNRNIGIQNSNQMINNYNNTNTGHRDATPNQTTMTHSYNLGASNNELPFIHRLMSSYHHQHNQSNMDMLPKVNLQVPSMLSPGEIAMINGYNPYSENSVDIYVHTLVTQNTGNNITNNIVTNIANNGNINTNITTNNSGTNTQSTTTNVNNENTGMINTDLINNLLSSRTQPITQTNVSNPILTGNSNITSQPNNQTITNSTDTTNPREPNYINNLIENLMNIIGQPTNRRGSVGSDTSRDSTPHPFRTNRSTTNTTTQPIVQPNNQNLANLLTNNRNTVRNSNSSTRPLEHLYRDNSSQTELPINLLTLQKDNL
jgi:hypothetical protein